MGVDVHEVDQLRQPADQRLVDGEPATVMRGRVVERPQDAPARIREQLELAQEGLRRGPGLRLVGLVAVGGILPVQVKDDTAAVALPPQEGKGVRHRSRTGMELGPGMAVEEALIGICYPIVGEEDEVVGHATRRLVLRCRCTSPNWRP
jgi:hypothetical protein